MLVAGDAEGLQSSLPLYYLVAAGGPAESLAVETTLQLYFCPAERPRLTMVPLDCPASPLA